jgi:hypothetical protein
LFHYTLGKDTLSKAKELDEKYEVMDTVAAKVADFSKQFEFLDKQLSFFVPLYLRKGYIEQIQRIR